MVDRRNRIVLTGTPLGGGSALVLRLRPDGRRDRSFGRNGIARTRLPFLPTDVSEPRGGRIVLAGTWAGGNGRNSTAYVARLRYGR